MSRPPSQWQLERGMSALQQAKERLLADDPDLAEDSLLLQSMLEGDIVAGDYMEILHNVLRAAVHASELAEAAKVHAAKIAARAQRYANRAATLRACGFDAMQALELRRVELPELTATVRKGSPSVTVVDETRIPDEFWRVRREIAKSVIHKALLEGADVPGTTLSNAPDTIAIRTG